MYLSSLFKTGAVVSDIPYNSTSWDGVSTIAPSKNAVRDQRELDAISMFRKNVIINGNFDVWQRGTSFSEPSGDFTADRWWMAFDGNGDGTCDLTRETFTVGQTDVPNEPAYFIRIDQSVAATGQILMSLSNRIEDVRTFAGKTITLSLYIKALANETLPYIYMSQVFGGGGSGTINPTFVVDQDITTSWVKYTFTMAIPSISGKTLGTNHYLALIISLPTNETFQIDIAQVQIEEGSVATQFEYRSYGEELALCQRYFEWTGGVGKLQSMAGIVYASGYITTCVIMYNVIKRVSPTITISQLSGQGFPTDNSPTLAESYSRQIGFTPVFVTDPVNADQSVGKIQFVWEADAEL